MPVTVQAILAARIDRLGPDAKQLLQVASVVGKEVGARALRTDRRARADELDPVLCELIEAGFLYEAELYPERVLAFRHPLTREVAYGTQLADRRAATHAAAARATIELEPDRHDELAALIAHHMEAGGETLEAARWYARAAYWAGHTRPQDALRLWQRVTELVDGARGDRGDEGAGGASRACCSSTSPGAWGWTARRPTRWRRRRPRSPTRTGDLRSLALLKLLTAARPGIAEHSAEWVAAAEEADRSWPTNRASPTLRIAVRGAGAYARCAPATSTASKRTIDEMLELTGGDPTMGAGIVHRLPGRLGADARRRSPCASATGSRRPKRCSTRRCASPPSTTTRRPRAGRAAPGACCSPTAANVEAALALARRNCELTDQLGDVFSRSTALNCARLRADRRRASTPRRWRRSSSATATTARRWAPAARPRPGASTLRARALLGLGRNEEALEETEWAADVARGGRWAGRSPPPATPSPRPGQRPADAPGVEEALDEAAEAAGAGVTR